MKHTIHISSPSHLSLRNHQLLIRNKETEKVNTVAIEDIATIILADTRSTLSTAILSRCIAEGIALVSCDERYMPVGMFLCLDSHTEQQSITAAQLSASAPLHKQLWQSTIAAKVKNQSSLLEIIGASSSRIEKLAKQVKSGDSTGIEAQAARLYWQIYFGSINAHHDIPEPTYRKRDGFPPNNWLNYGYAILRSNVTRALTASGLLPLIGIHHHNKYNAYCLADDIMEPYRPVVDRLVHDLSLKHELDLDIPMHIKQELLKLPTVDCALENKKYTLQAALERTTASLAQSFAEKKNKLIYPQIL